MTIKELKEILENWPESMPVFIIRTDIDGDDYEGELEVGDIMIRRGEMIIG